MANSVTVIKITHAETANQMKAYGFGLASNPKALAAALSQYFAAVGAGVRNASIDIQVAGGTTGVKASGTVTFSSNPSANDTVTVNGVAFTAKSSGAVGDQFNIGGTVTLTAAALAAAINASSTANVVGVVTATSALGVATVSAVEYGKVGNLITLAKSGANIAVSAANLASGANVTANANSFGL